MLINYLKFAFRHIWRNRSTSLINIIGLAIGMGSVFMILLFIINEFSYDQFHENKERIYRVISYNKNQGWYTPQAPHPLSDYMMENWPEVELAAPMYSINYASVKKGENYLPERHLIASTDDFHQILSLKFIHGDSRTPLKNPGSAIISRSMAQKYFNKTDVAGEVMELNIKGEKFPLKITAVMKDLPVNSSLKADMIASEEIGIHSLRLSISTTGDANSYTEETIKNAWDMSLTNHLVLTRQAIDAESLQAEFDRLISEKHEDDWYMTYSLQAYSHIHLKSQAMMNSIYEVGDMKLILIFGAIGFVLLCISIFNFLILISSKMVYRNKEITIRKTLGAQPGTLRKQFFIESILISLLATLLGVILLEQFRPAVNRFFEKTLMLDGNMSLIFLVSLFLITLLIAMIPSLYITRYAGRIKLSKHASSLNQVKSKQRFTKLLMFIQYIAFIALVAFAIGIKKQLDYTQNKSMGLKLENKVALAMNNQTLTDHYESFRQLLLQDPDVKQVSAGFAIPPTTSQMAFPVDHPKNKGQKVNMELLFVKNHYVDAMELELLQGKKFSDFQNPHAQRIILNEEAVNALGFEDPLSETFMGSEIIGVVKNFHQHPLHMEIGPMVLATRETGQLMRQILIHFNTDDREKMDAILTKACKTMDSSINPEYKLLEDRALGLYGKERKMAVIISILALTAICISILGLIGLTIFSTRKRTKEIAIRKINGASPASILGTLLSGYVKLIILAGIIAIPIAFHLLQKWLQIFAYTTSLSWWIFGLALAAALLVTFAAVSWHSIRAARKNPVESLRYE